MHSLKQNLAKTEEREGEGAGLIDSIGTAAAGNRPCSLEIALFRLRFLDLSPVPGTFSIST